MTIAYAPIPRRWCIQDDEGRVINHYETHDEAREALEEMEAQ